MKKILLMVSVMSLIASSAIAASGKLAYVDIMKVYEKTNLGKKYQGIIREYIDSRQRIVDEQKAEIKKMQDEYLAQKQTGLVKSKDLDAKRESIGREMNELEKRGNEFSQEIEKKRDGLLNDFSQKMTAVIKDIAKKEKYSMVFSKAISAQAAPLVIYGDDDLDITAAVITDMDKKEDAK